jgi:hypothetical protein
MTVVPVLVIVDPAKTAKDTAVPRSTGASAAIILTGATITAQIRIIKQIDINRKTDALISIKPSFQSVYLFVTVVDSNGLTTLAIAIFEGR